MNATMKAQNDALNVALELSGQPLTAREAKPLPIEVVRETLDDLLRRHATGRVVTATLDRMTGYGRATVQDFAGYRSEPFSVVDGLVSFVGASYRPSCF